MEFIASVKNKETKEIQLITKEYSSKKEFKKDLIGNGYSVRFITTEENFENDCINYNEQREKAKKIATNKYKSDKEISEKVGMTVQEYRLFLKSIS